MFSILFLLLGYPDETLSFLFDTLVDKPTLSNFGLEKREKFQNFSLPLAMLQDNNNLTMHCYKYESIIIIDSSL